MYLAGFSINNLTLMALTIATGFVVDDAIVMIENIARYIEAGRNAAAGGAERRRADRLHHHLADHLADRGADPAAVHGRRRRPAVPRVRDHAGGGHPDLRGGVADADADDVRAAAAARPDGAADALLPAAQRVFDAADRALRPDAGLGAATPGRNAAGGRRHPGADRPAVHRRAQGLLSRPGYRASSRASPRPRRRSPLPRWPSASRRWRG